MGVRYAHSPRRLFAFPNSYGVLCCDLAGGWGFAFPVARVSGLFLCLLAAGVFTFFRILELLLM